ncbi:MAG: efflux RND transporter periplasmic adaptor subunit [Planctomycetota bacterium]|jgi:HlyD family secretion protein
MKKRKWLWLVIAVVIVAAAGLAALKLQGGGNDAIQVETSPVGRMEIVETVTATGRIQPKTQVNISADVSAKITRLEVDEGDWVEKGALLLELDRERYQAAVESAEASLRVSQANANVDRENMIKAEKDYVRIKELFDRDLETQAQLDAAHAEFQAARARHQSALDRVEQTRATLKQSRDDLSKTTIHSPMAGTVSELNKEQGEIALGSQFQEDVIMVIANLAGMEALVDVDENDIVSVALGDRATIEVDALPETVFNGKVTEIANSAKVSGSGTTDQKTEFEVKIEITDMNSELRLGMTSSSDIVTETHENALGVPIQSVAVRTLEQLQRAPANGPGLNADEPATDWQPDKDGFVEIVFVIENGVARARQVKTGIQSETHIEILEGLSEGDEVVVGNYRAISKDLEDGSLVVVSDQDGNGAG